MFEELIKELREWPRVAASYEGSIDHLLDRAAGAIEELIMIAESYMRSMDAWADTAAKAIEQIPNWVSVSERLPEEEVPVQVTYLGYNDKQPRTDMHACLYCGQWCYWDGDPCNYEKCRVEITHWQPLPVPAKEKGEVRHGRMDLP